MKTQDVTFDIIPHDETYEIRYIGRILVDGLIRWVCETNDKVECEDLVYNELAKRGLTVNA